MCLETMHNTLKWTSTSLLVQVLEFATWIGVSRQQELTGGGVKIASILLEEHD